MRAMDFTLGIYAAPIWGDGDYPKTLRDECGDRLPKFTKAEKKMLMDSSDFFGLNHYSTRKAGRPSVAVALGTLPREITSLWKSVGSAGRFWEAIKPMINPFQSSYFKDMGVGVYPDPEGTQ
jgi:hypothetical protein